jgi:hypothetical protein
MVMNHGDTGYLLWRGLALSASDRTSPRSQYIMKLMTSLMMSWRTLTNVSWKFLRDVTRARMHTDMLTESVNSWLYSVLSVELTLWLITKSLRCGIAAPVPNVGIRWRWMLSSFSSRFITGTNRSCLLDMGIYMFIYTLQVVWSLWWDGIFLPNKPRHSSA